MPSPEGTWFIEYSSPYQAHMHAVSRYIFMGATSYQKVEIADTFTFGRCLILDGKIQSSEFDEYIYHETLVHPAVAVHPQPRRVLVMGGAEGAVIRELFRYPFVERVVMVDIDREVVELCQKFLPTWHQGSFDHPRLELVYSDARAYLENTGEQFDLIISDITEPVDNGPSYLLFTREFYALLKSRLTAQGVLSLQAGSLSMALLDVHPPIRNTLQLSFEVVTSFHAFIPSFDTTWGFIIASKGSDPAALSPHGVARRIKEARGELRFYDAETHRAMFSIPKNVREAFKEDQRTIEDARPLTVY